MAKQFQVDLIISSVLGSTQLDTQIALVSSPVWNRGVVRTPVTNITEEQVRTEFEAQLDGIINALREDFEEAMSLRFPQGEHITETYSPPAPQEIEVDS